MTLVFFVRYPGYKFQGELPPLGRQTHWGWLKFAIFDRHHRLSRKTVRDSPMDY